MADFIRDQLDHAARYVAEQREAVYRGHMDLMVLKSKRTQAALGSPLETAFLLWWHAVQYATDKYRAFELELQAEVTIREQHYRVDFLITPDGLDPDLVARWTPIVVELDGHAFHERTKEQVQTRDSRDRALTSAGWKVFHFSYSEFTADPVACVTEVAEFAFLQSIRRQYSAVTS